MAGTKMVSPGSKITSMTFTPGRLDALMSFNGRKIPSMLGKGHDIFRRKGEGQWGTGHKWSVYSLYRHTSRKRRICFSKNSREKAEHGLYLHQIAMGTAGVLKGATQKARLIVIKWWRTMHLWKKSHNWGDSKSWLPKPMATNPVCCFQSWPGNGPSRCSRALVYPREQREWSVFVPRSAWAMRELKMDQCVKEWSLQQHQ